MLQADAFEGIEVEHSLDDFKRRSDIIAANRMTGELKDVANKVFTSDLFKRD